MAETTAQAFDEFRDRISLSEGHKKKANDRAKTTASTLKKAFPESSTTPIKSGGLMGSVVRGTAIRPLDDIDMLAVFKNKNQVFEKYRHDSQAFLYHVRNSVNAKTEVQKVGARGQAVRLFYQDGLHVDIAPVFRWSSGAYGLPAGDGSWVTTDPPKQQRWIEQREQKLNYQLKKRVKLLKSWNGAHSSRLSSWHLEVMVATVFKSMNRNSRDGLMRFFEWAPRHISVNDPDGYGGDLSDYLTSTNRQAVRKSFNTAHDRASNAVAAEGRGDHREAIRLWGIVLGKEFPSYTGR